MINRHIPLRRVYSNNQAPWYNRYLNRLSNKKKRLFRTARNSLKPERWTAYKSAALAYSRALKTTKFSFFNVTLPNILKSNPKRFWSIIKPSTNDKVSLLSATGNPIPDHLCATSLNDSFVQSFSSSSVDRHHPKLQSCNYYCMDPIVFDSHGIIPIINNLKQTSSSGIDGINSKFLRNTVEYTSIILESIFSQSYHDGVLPEDWKTAKVIPVHKAGDKQNPSNYRPISLTSIPCKIMEHIILTHLVNFLEDNSFFSLTQHGFRKGFSCETQLLSFTNDLHFYLDSAFSTDCIFLDFAKAFDKVNHSLLLYKLSILNIDPSVLNWIRAFLFSRLQFVHANDTNSSTVPVGSGVPQGSVLGPLLFLIYINDLPATVNSRICLFADDCVIYRKITNDSDIRSLQVDLNNILDWCHNWKMELNIKKCKSMRVSRSNTTCPPYFLHSHPLESVRSYRYLGIHITNTLSWKLHIEHIASKANKTLGYLRRNFTLAPSSLKSLLYMTYVRPQMEYASSIWDPGQVSLTQVLETVQNRATRFILGNYHRTSSVTQMKKSLNLLPLATRRKHFRICLFHKIFYSNFQLRSRWIQPAPFISHRRDHQHKVTVPHCNTVTCAQSYFPLTSKEWNSLPASLTSITDSTQFRRILTTLIT